MSSYQNRKDDIKYYQQVERELLTIIRQLNKRLVKHGISSPMIAVGVKGSDYMTPYNQAYRVEDIIR